MGWFLLSWLIWGAGIGVSFVVRREGNGIVERYAGGKIGMDRGRVMESDWVQALEIGLRVDTNNQRKLND